MVCYVRIDGLVFEAEVLVNTDEWVVKGIKCGGWVW